MMQDIHMFQGMRRDNHPIRQDKQFLWDAHNIRLTNRDGNTMLSISNEKSTRYIKEFPEGQDYIGHCVLGDYLIVFTHGRLKENDKNVNDDIIFRIKIIDNDCEMKVLYRGDLNFNVAYPIQTLGVAESDLVQKVWWTDGVNPVRMINIKKPELLVNPSYVEEPILIGYTKIYHEAPFNLIRDLDLNEVVTIKRTSGSGIFPAGVIQYCFTYYDRFGSESNIFYTSDLFYIAHSDRGGSPEDSIPVAFNIEIRKPQRTFDYIRVYSIIRTSINATPTVKRIVDLPISSNTSSLVTYVDDNTTGDIITPTQLLYLGGSNIIAGCLASKDNTLFLGNVILSNPGAVPKSLREPIKNTKIYNCNLSLPLPNIEDTDISNGYEYYTQLNTNFCTFKYGETYRLGLQFQYKDGSWSAPVFCQDKIAVSQTPEDNQVTESRPSYMGGAIVNSINFKTTLSSPIKEALKKLEYKKVRPVVVLPSTNDRTILAQGILCPTVFNAYNRLNNSPFSQSSWFFRPHSFNTKSESIKEGSYVESSHYKPILSGFNNGAEIQNMYLSFNSTSRDEGINEITLKKAGDQLDVNNNLGYSPLYYVDQSILTFHSPDIEFDDDVSKIIASEPNLHIRLIGAVEFNTSYGTIDIQTSTPAASARSTGALNNIISNSVDGGKSLISGLYYLDAEMWSQDNKIVLGTDAPQYWKIYPWQRSGSLNNDINRSDGTTSTSVLKKKVISNIKISNKHYWLNKYYPLNTDSIDIFNSNEIELVKIRDNANKCGNITYFGNVDSLNISYQPFRLVTTNPIVDGTSDQQFIASVNGSELKLPITERDQAIGSFTINVLDLPGFPPGRTFVKVTEMDGSSATITITDASARQFTYKDVAYRIEDGIIAVNVAYDLDHEVHALDPPTDKLKPCKGLYAPKDPVRIKYKSTPHAVVALSYDKSGHRSFLPYTTIVKNGEILGTGKVDIIDDEYWLKNTPKEKLSTPNIRSIELLLSGNSGLSSSYLWMAEIYRDEESIVNRFGGTSEEALQNNIWLPAGDPVNLDEEIIWRHGDTWLQRYDCLKTYPFTKEDENQVVEIGSFACETHVNIDGRYDRNRGNIDNSHVSPENFNLINPVYSQLNNFFTYRILDDLYYRINKYPNQIIWSLPSIPNSDVDVWTQINPASNIDLDSKNGKVTSINAYNEHLIALQENGMNELLFNSRIQVATSDNTPIEIANSGRMDGYRVISNNIGCQDKFNVITTSRGIYFIDNYRNTCYLFNNSIEDLGLKLGTNYWFRENSTDYPWSISSSQYNKKGGIKLCYDSKYQDVYFNPANYLSEDSSGNLITVQRDSLCYSELLGQFTSFMSYGNSDIFNLKDKCLAIAFSEKKYGPRNLCLWEVCPENSNLYNEIFGRIRPYSFSFISNDNPAITKVFDTIEMRADSYNNGKLLGDKYSMIHESGQPFNYIEVSNEYQDTGRVEFNSSTLRKKFRIWRGTIPRNKNTRERIRNPWAKITLGMENPDTKVTILHDINVNYTV